MSLARLTVLVSGRGSNLGALIDASADARFGGAVTHVVSNRPGAGALEHARRHAIAAEVVDHRAFETREAFESALVAAIDAGDPDLVILAGFMRVLSPATVDRYRGRLINIHPSLLPAYPGLDTHRRARADGVRVHGSTLREAALALGYVSAADFERWVRPEAMTGPGR